MRTWMAWCAVVAAGCSSRDRSWAPGPERQWITLEEFQGRELRKGTAPVVEVPPDTELRVRLTREPSPTPFWTTKLGEDNPLAMTDTPTFSVKVRRPVYLDLERMTLSVDKERWWTLGQVLFPDFMAAEFTFAREGKEVVTRPLDAYVYVHFGWPRVIR